MLFSFRSLKLSRSLVVADGVHVLVRAVLLCDFAPGRVRGVWFTCSHPGKSILRVNASAVIEKGMVPYVITLRNETSAIACDSGILVNTLQAMVLDSIIEEEEEEEEENTVIASVHAMHVVYICGRWCKRAAPVPSHQSSSARPSGNEAR